jgi:amino-acid N-acetyltransferase
MDQAFDIRPAQAGDWDSVEGLLIACDLPSKGVREYLGETYVVATHENSVIGIAGIEVYGEHGLLRSVAVSPAWRGKSLGGALVKERLAWAEAGGLTHVFLLTTDAAGYFEVLGFTPIDREDTPDEIKVSPEFASICPETAIVMVKPINTPV